MAIKDDLQQLNNELFPDNDDGLILPEDVREFNGRIVDNLFSWFPFPEDTVARAVFTASGNYTPPIDGYYRVTLCGGGGGGGRGGYRTNSNTAAGGGGGGAGLPSSINVPDSWVVWGSKSAGGGGGGGGGAIGGGGAGGGAGAIVTALVHLRTDNAYAIVVGTGGAGSTEVVSAGYGRTGQGNENSPGCGIGGALWNGAGATYGYGGCGGGSIGSIGQDGHDPSLDTNDLIYPGRGGAGGTNPIGYGNGGGGGGGMANNIYTYGGGATGGATKGSDSNSGSGSGGNGGAGVVIIEFIGQ